MGCNSDGGWLRDADRRWVLREPVGAEVPHDIVEAVIETLSTVPVIETGANDGVDAHGLRKPPPPPPPLRCRPRGKYRNNKWCPPPARLGRLRGTCWARRICNRLLES